MQSVPTGNVLGPASSWIIWLIGVIGITVFMLFVGWIVRRILRAFQTIEKRSSVAEEVLLLSARVAQQERELAELRAAMQRLQAPQRATKSDA